MGRREGGAPIAACPAARLVQLEVIDMLIEGSCHCGRVAFEMETKYVYPLMWCYCGRCRKTNGSPVSAYVKGKKADLGIRRGKDSIRLYRIETSERFFCGECGSSLYAFDARWPEDCWPNAAAIDTPLPSTPEVVHIFVGSKIPWFTIHTPGPQFDEYPELSIEDYHREWELV